ncbi:FAD-binding oxidoreductase [Candidatus Puniceispirillum marinum]|uniref:FAD linked oxidase-like protein n=1 Tax=Puniceispirillum marinum (strain IMCC1322) TaxID=488538 RepID=D5BTM9_PUNMI|nr:FAD-binding oxidoreductase [Candidatus Puniceispirillum marinum]ADE39626.1 FAD linked oxidase-like protein [Candidatus Puniceispirillum marinum IMCC1322]
MKITEQEIIDECRAICGDAHVETGNDIDPKYQRDWLDKYPSSPFIVVRPDSTEKVAALMKLCTATKTAVIPLGGNSGLTGATQAHPDQKAVIMSLERMNMIRDVNGDGRYMIAESGCIVENLHKAADQAGWMFPLVFGAKGTAHIGGALGTNAGGLNVVRYGNARALCLGLEVVTAAGDIMNLLPALKKDNTGYDLVNLMIGSEGTLGIITAATLTLVPKPAAYATAMVVVPDIKAALKLMNLVQNQTGGRLEAYELMDQVIYDLCVTNLDHVTAPFDYSPAFSILMEIAAGSPDDVKTHSDGRLNLATQLETILAMAFEQGLADDAIIANSEAQRQNLWAMREGALGAIQKHGNWVMSDVSFQVADLPNAIEDLKAAFAAVAPGPFCVAFGHMGDGNLHAFARPYDEDPKDHPTEAAAIKAALRDTVVKWHGSISAEHGIGQDKQAEMKQLKDPVAYAMMKSIKAALDPDNILNPGKVLL